MVVLSSIIVSSTGIKTYLVEPAAGSAPKSNLVVNLNIRFTPRSTQPGVIVFMSLLNDLTIIIPTHNRHDFLNQTLSVIAETANTDGLHLPKFIIIDSSVELQSIETLAIIEHLSAQYLRVNEDLFTKLERASRLVQTNYVIVLADDDFLNIKALSNLTKKASNTENIVFPYIHFSEADLNAQSFL